MLDNITNAFKTDGRTEPEPDGARIPPRKIGKFDSLLLFIQDRVVITLQKTGRLAPPDLGIGREVATSQRDRMCGSLWVHEKLNATVNQVVAQTPGNPFNLGEVQVTVSADVAASTLVTVGICNHGSAGFRPHSRGTEFAGRRQEPARPELLLHGRLS